MLTCTDTTFSRRWKTALLEPQDHFPVTSKFTDSILRHGGKLPNTTLDECTNAKRRMAAKAERYRKRAAAMELHFRREVKEVERLKILVRAQHKKAAYIAMQTCLAVMVQSLWRGHVGRRCARTMRLYIAARVICKHWLKHHAEVKIWRAQRRLARCMRRWRYRREAAARSVQKTIRMYLAKVKCRILTLAVEALDLYMDNYIYTLAIGPTKEYYSIVIQQWWRQFHPIRSRLTSGLKRRKKKKKKGGATSSVGSRSGRQASNTSATSTFLTQQGGPRSPPQRGQHGGVLADDGEKEVRERTRDQSTLSLESVSSSNAPHRPQQLKPSSSNASVTQRTLRDPSAPVR